MEGDIDTAIQELLQNQAKLEDKAKRFKSTINADYGMLDDLVKDITRQKKALTEAKALLAAKRKLASADEARGDVYRAHISSVTESIEKLHRSYVPETGSLFVRLFLGQVNVKQYRDGERNHLKLEYEKFKRRTNVLLLAFVFVQFFMTFRPVEIIFQVWLLYYYVSLALRENILRVNGSNIKPWWIVHHYLSILVSLSLLLFPPSKSVQELYAQFRPIFLYFTLCQGFVQNLMNRYQSYQLYKQIAMGRATNMDVTGEAGFTSWAPSALVLLPFLLIFYVFQLYIARVLFEFFIFERSEWQAGLGAMIFVVLGVGNLWTTLYTYYKNRLFTRRNSTPRITPPTPSLQSPDATKKE